MEDTYTPPKMTEEERRAIVGVMVDFLAEKVLKMETNEIVSCDGDYTLLRGTGFRQFKLLGYSVEMDYEVSCGCKAWMEYWNDPPCNPWFEDYYDEEGHVEELYIGTEDDEISADDVKDVIREVNEKVYERVNGPLPHGTKK